MEKATVPSFPKSSIIIYCEDKALITIQNLTKTYGAITAVENLSLSLESGHIYGLLGANGAGKSTTLNMLCGCLTPSGGSVKINGYDLESDGKKAKSYIGYLPEIPPLYGDMTPREFLEFVASVRIGKGNHISHIDEIMEKTQIFDVADRLIKNLSKGYRQRVGIAQALIGDPEIIVLDEPTVGLDPRQRVEIRALISSLGKDHTVILSSHILSEVSDVCDRIIIIENGKLIACDSPENLEKTFLGPDILKISVKGDKKAVLDVVKTISLPEKAVFEEISPVGTVIFSVKCPKDISLEEEIFFAFAKARLAITSLERLRPSLEDLFLKATEQKSALYPEADKKDDSKKSPLLTMSQFLKSQTKSEKEDKNESDDDDDSYRPLFGRK